MINFIFENYENKLAQLINPISYKSNSQIINPIINPFFFFSLAVEMRALVNGSEALARGPTRSFESGSVTEQV
jgi:hypothetical protein